MKKKLFLVLVVMLSLVVSKLYAAEGDALKFYGVAHASIDSLDDGDESRLYISSNTSAFGIKGELELDVGELKAFYQMEQEISIDESGKNLASRNSFVGIKGGFGKILMGRNDSPFKIAAAGTQKIFQNQIGDYRNIAGVGGAGFDLRPSNIIAYETPSLAGFNVMVAYSTEDDVDDSDIISAYVLYKLESLNVYLAFEDHGEAVASTNIDSESGVRLGLNYKVGIVTLELLHETLSDVAGVSGADKDATGGAIGINVTENSMIKATFFTTDGIDGKDESGANMYGIGFDQKLSDKTTVYINYAVTDNDDAAKYAVTGGGHGDKVVPVTGEKATGISLGLIHKF